MEGRGDADGEGDGVMMEMDEAGSDGTDAGEEGARAPGLAATTLWNQGCSGWFTALTPFRMVFDETTRVVVQTKASTVGQTHRGQFVRCCSLLRALLVHVCVLYGGVACTSAAGSLVRATFCLYRIGQLDEWLTEARSRVPRNPITEFTNEMAAKIKAHALQCRRKWRRVDDDERDGAVDAACADDDALGRRLTAEESGVLSELIGVLHVFTRKFLCK